jgi:ABC-type sulfate transport system permease subunit
MFCATGLNFGGTDGVDSQFHVKRSRTHFGWYRGRRVPFSCFALPDSFSAVPRASCLVFMFCAPGPVFSGTEAPGSVIMFGAPGLIFGDT